MKQKNAERRAAESIGNPKERAHAGHQSPDAKAKLTLRRGRHGGLMVDLPLRGLCIFSSY
jgi:hypothetical protein